MYNIQSIMLYVTVNMHNFNVLKFVLIVVQWRNPRFTGYYKRSRIKGKFVFELFVKLESGG